jgi:hypothetical protein
MPIKETSPSREGRDQRSDSPTKDVASSNGKVRDFATRQETYQHAAGNDLSQQGVGEREQSVIGGNSQESTRRAVLRLRGGSDDWVNSFARRMVQDAERSTISDLRTSGSRAASDLMNLGKLGWNAFQRHKQKKEAKKLQQELQARHAEAERCQKETEEQISKLYHEDLTRLRQRRQRIQNITFDEYRESNPDCDLRTFARMRQSKLEEIDEEINFMLRLNPKQWYDLKKYQEEHNRGRAGSSNQGTSTSRG